MFNMDDDNNKESTFNTYLNDIQKDEYISELTYHFLDSLSDSVNHLIVTSLEEFNRLDIQNTQNVIFLALINYYKTLLEDGIVTENEILELANDFNNDFNQVITNILNKDSGDVENGN